MGDSQNKLRSFEDWWDSAGKNADGSTKMVAWSAWLASLEAATDYLTHKPKAPAIDADDWNKIRKEEAGGFQSGTAKDLGLY